MQEIRVAILGGASPQILPLTKKKLRKVNMKGEVTIFTITEGVVARDGVQEA